MYNTESVLRVYVLFSRFFNASSMYLSIRMMNIYAVLYVLEIEEN